MVNTNYYSMDFGPNQTVQRSVGGKQKTQSGKRNIFRGISIGKSDSSSSLPGAESLSGQSEEFRDEPEEKNNKNNNRTPVYGASREVSTRRDDIHMSDDFFFNPFEIIPSWGFNDNGEIYTNGRTKAPEEFEAFQIKSPEEFEAFHVDPKPRSTPKTKKSNHEYKPESSRQVATMRPAALKLDQWSKSLSRKKNQFKYHSFTNERRVSRPKKNSKEKESISSFESPVVESRNDIEQIDNVPENFPSLNDETVMNDLFPPNARDDCEGNLIVPLMPNTKLRLAVQETPTKWDHAPDFTKVVEPPCENLVLESVSLKKQYIAPNDVEMPRDKQRDFKPEKSIKSEEQNVEKEGKTVYEPSNYPSEGDHSSVVSGATENIPLLRAWGMKMVDCNECGNSKAQKKQKKAKKKRAEARKKILEDLWDRKQFYWKYESVEDQRKEYLEQMDTLVFKIASEVDDCQDEAIMEMPLGFQLSTITEGDEDATACCSPRSMGIGSLHHDGKVTLSTPVDTILDMINKDDEEEDEAEDFPREPAAHGSNNKPTESPGSRTFTPEQPKKSRPKRRMRVLSLDEIEIHKSFDETSSGHSRGNISDITEDYLNIPFSSPLYKKVLKAFREAEAAQKDGKNETSEEIEKYLYLV